MKKFNLEVTEQNFNLLWRSLDALEKKLLQVIADNEDNEDSEEAAFAGNDLVYLRMYRDDLKRDAETAGFNKSAFSLSDTVIS